MSRIAICEPSLSGEGGHYLYYSMMVAKAAREQGFSPIIFGNVTYSGKNRDGIQIIPVFTHDIWGERSRTRLNVRRQDKFVFSKLLENPALVYASEHNAFKHYNRESPLDDNALVEELARAYGDGSLPPLSPPPREMAQAATVRALIIGKKLASRFGKPRSPSNASRLTRTTAVTETCRAIASIFAQLSEGDQILFPSMSFLLTKAVGQVFETSPVARQFDWHFLYRRNLVTAGPIDKNAQWAAHSARHAIRYMSSRAKTVRYRLYTDTDRLTAEYETLIGLPFHTLPIPALDAISHEPEPRPDTGASGRVIPTIVAYKQGGISIPESLSLERLVRGLGMVLRIDTRTYADGAPPYAANLLHREIPVFAKAGDPGSRTPHAWTIHLVLCESPDARGRTELDTAFAAAASNDLVVATPQAYQMLLQQQAAEAGSAARVDDGGGAPPIPMLGSVRIDAPARLLAVKIDPAVTGMVSLQAVAAMADGTERSLSLCYEAIGGAPVPVPVPLQAISLTLRACTVEGEPCAALILPDFMPSAPSRVLMLPKGHGSNHVLKQCEDWCTPAAGAAAPTSAAGHGTSATAGDTAITIAYFGDARPEKGYRDLFDVAKSLADSADVKFLVQSNCPENSCDLDILKTRIVFQRMPRATVFLEALDEASYAEFIRQSDLVWVMYDRRAYFSRSSGIFAEAATAGRTVLTSAGSWMAACLDEMAHAYHARQFAGAPVMAEMGLEGVVRNGGPGMWPWVRDAANSGDQLVLRLGAHPLSSGAARTGYLWLSFRVAEMRVPFYVHVAFRDRNLCEVNARVERFVGDAAVEYSIAIPVTPDAEDAWLTIQPQNGEHQVTVTDLRIRHLLHGRFVPITPGGFKISQEGETLPQCQAAILSYLLHKDEHRAAAEYVAATFRQYHSASNIVAGIARQDAWCESIDRVSAR